jgi:hypothetical protein
MGSHLLVHVSLDLERREVEELRGISVRQRQAVCSETGRGSTRPRWPASRG